MSDEEADLFVVRSLAWRQGGPGEVTVGLLYVPAVTNAFVRAGFLVEGTDVPGRLRIEHPLVDDSDEARLVGTEVLRTLRSRRITKIAAARLFNQTESESDDLWASRFEAIDLTSLRRMAERLERI